MLFLSAKNVLNFIKNCGTMSLSPPNLDKIDIDEKNELNKKYYLDTNFVKNNFSNKDNSMLLKMLLKIYSLFDMEYLLDLIKVDNYAKLFFELIYPEQKHVKLEKIKKKMNENQINRFNLLLIWEK